MEVEARTPKGRPLLILFLKSPSWPIGFQPFQGSMHAQLQGKNLCLFKEPLGALTFIACGNGCTRVQFGKA